ncbi:MAG: hypothetical protein KJ645_08945, partial [Planctomycetes bacterium]|nr:hypothetical protein [Planctomycetota bacterium]
MSIIQLLGMCRKVSVRYQIVVPVCFCILLNTVAFTFFSVRLTCDTLFEKEHHRLRQELEIFAENAEMGLLTERESDLLIPLQTVLGDPAVTQVTIFDSQGTSLFSYGEETEQNRLDLEPADRELLLNLSETMIYGEIRDGKNWLRQTELS